MGVTEQNSRGGILRRVRVALIAAAGATAGALILASPAWGAFEICTVAANCQPGAIGALAGEMETPRGVAVGPTGSVYVADGVNRRIQKFDSAGNFERAWGRDVISGNMNTGFEICVAGVDTCKAGTAGNLGGEVSSPGGVATDTAGNVYVIDGASVERFNSLGTWDRVWGKNVDSAAGTGLEVCTTAANCQGPTAGSAGGELSNPSGVGVDSTGLVYVGDKNNHRVQKFTAAGAFVSAWGKNVDNVAAGTGYEVCTVIANCKAGETDTALGGEMNNPFGIAVDGNDNIYVADQFSHRIQRFSSSGAFVHTWGLDVITGGTTGLETCSTAANCKAGLNNTPAGGMSFPSPLAFSPGSIYVTDAFHRVVKYDLSGTLQRVWGKGVDSVAPGTGFEICTVAANCTGAFSGGLGGEMNGPDSVAADATGNAFVGDRGNNRIQRFDSSGNFVRTWGNDVDNTPPSVAVPTTPVTPLTPIATPPVNPQCAALRAQLKKAKSKRKKRKIRQRLRALGC
jgi:hypothetical protein